MYNGTNVIPPPGYGTTTLCRAAAGTAPCVLRSWLCSTGSAFATPPNGKRPHHGFLMEPVQPTDRNLICFVEGTV